MKALAGLVSSEAPPWFSGGVQSPCCLFPQVFLCTGTLLLSPPPLTQTAVILGQNRLHPHSPHPPPMAALHQLTQAFSLYVITS